MTYFSESVQFPNALLQSTFSVKEDNKMKIKVNSITPRPLLNNMLNLSINHIEWKFRRKEGSIKVKEAFEDHVIHNLYTNTFICWYFDGHRLHQRIRVLWTPFIHTYIVIGLHVCIHLASCLSLIYTRLDHQNQLSPFM